MYFLKEVDLYRLNENNSNICIIPINNNVKGKRHLISTISRGINSPYICDNWDGLDEALRDLSWMSEHEVRIIHYDLPLLLDPDMRIYLTILKTIEEYWVTIEDNVQNNCKLMNICFPDSLKDLILSDDLDR